MSKIKFFKETALPATPVANALYLITKTINGVAAAELYATNSTGGSGSARQVSTEALVNAIIGLQKGANNGLASLDSGGKVPVGQLPSGIGIDFEIVDDIAARNALSPTKNILCLVLDATGDATVSTGSALYAYELAATTWHKVSEYESLDLSGLMTSFGIKVGTGATETISQGETITFVAGSANITIVRSGNTLTFDVSGGAAHSHSNLTQLNKIGEDGDGDITYNGAAVMKWTSTAW
jgi:hypothetical protein